MDTNQIESIKELNEDWRSKIIQAVGDCIRDQKNGYDVLASASWDRVVEIWHQKP